MLGFVPTFHGMVHDFQSSHSRQRRKTWSVPGSFWTRRLLRRTREVPDIVRFHHRLVEDFLYEGKLYRLKPGKPSYLSLWSVYIEPHESDDRAEIVFRVL